MVPMHLTATRYQETPISPWKTALYAGSLSALADELERYNGAGARGGDHFPVYEDGGVRRQQMWVVRLPTGRVFDVDQGSYIEKEKAHA